MTHRVFIDGAAGTTGLEIADRLKDRAEFELVRLDDDQRKDTAARREALNECDIAILCLPDEAAREAVALVVNRLKKPCTPSMKPHRAGGVAVARDVRRWPREFGSGVWKHAA